MISYKQDSFQEIIESENIMIIDGENRYEEHYLHAMNFYNLLQSFLETVDASRFVFTAFLGKIRKHHLLALTSILRLQHTQAMMNLRQVLEAGANAAYGIANPESEDFVDTDENGILNPTDALQKKRYKWLKENFPSGSDAIKRMKDSINKSSAHSNLVDAYRSFEFKGKEAHMPFFDIENDFHIKTALWQTANIALGIMDLFYGVNKDIGALKFIDNFEKQLHELELENQQIKATIAKEYPKK